MSATITHAQLATHRGKFISVTSGMSGHFAVMYWWNHDMDGFWEPWDTGEGRYETEDEARVEAVRWASVEGLPYLLPAAPVAELVMSDDRELLELAAKAAGLIIARCRLDDPMWRDMLLQGDHRTMVGWNPLTDDGDALRLAVKLNMRVSYLDFSGYAIAQCRRPDGPEVHEYCGPQPETDPYKATRRAIVLAAAQIGSTS